MEDLKRDVETGLFLNQPMMSKIDIMTIRE